MANSEHPVAGSDDEPERMQRPPNDGLVSQTMISWAQAERRNGFRRVDAGHQVYDSAIRPRLTSILRIDLRDKPSFGHLGSEVGVERLDIARNLAAHLHIYTAFSVPEAVTLARIGPRSTGTVS
jgi:hypothetical protein